MALREILRTDRADENLIEIWFAWDSPASADRTLDAIEQRWRRVARFPFSGRARDEFGPGVNGAESFLNVFKNSARSPHIPVSQKHLDCYLGEFSFRSNAMFDLLIGTL